MRQVAIPLIIGIGTLLSAVPFFGKVFGESDKSYVFIGLGASLIAGGVTALIQRSIE